MITISQRAQAGTLESNDIIIVLSPADSGIEIELESKVLFQYGDRIREVIETTLRQQGVEAVSVLANDHGALDCTIEARTLTALERTGWTIREDC
jgi:citrate lyase subunit gamma (acyl carrier protein)